MKEETVDQIKEFTETLDRMNKGDVSLNNKFSQMKKVPNVNYFHFIFKTFCVHYVVISYNLVIFMSFICLGYSNGDCNGLQYYRNNKDVWRSKCYRTGDATFGAGSGVPTEENHYRTVRIQESRLADKATKYRILFGRTG